ncbi:MAG TPA: asparaginase [Solirubrobacterales bacterium]|nr:asparaginase [Solirubrobacterales bacterium]
MPAERPAVRLLVAGGTIAMSGSPARPSQEAIDRLQVEAGAHVDAEVFATVPSVHFSPSGALALCKRAAEIAGSGVPVVVTHGTDLLEEVAFLCDLLHDGDAPIVFTGAMRTASAAGADGPANLHAAVAVAGDPAARGLGVLVSFAGTVHAARYVRKADSTSIDAFTSPQAGPLGRVEEGRFVLRWSPTRLPALDVTHLDAAVEILAPGLGSSPAALTAVVAVCDGLVLSVPGAGHTPPAFLAAAQEIAATKPVVAVARPWRGELLHNSYGFEGSEVDLRSGAIVCAGSLSPPAARVALMAGIGAGLTTRELTQFLTPYD